jgi:hypothetical protein
VASEAEPIAAPRQKRRRVDAAGPNGSISRLTTHSAPSNSTSRRFQRITHKELDRREKSLLNKEKELRARSDGLEQRAMSLARKEDEASIMMSRIAEREAELTLRQLEEHFMCAL